MNDPTRLLDDGGTTLEARLLRSGKTESPPAASMARALDLARQSAVATQPPTPTSAARVDAALKWTGIGLVGLSAGLLGVGIVNHATSRLELPSHVVRNPIKTEPSATAANEPWIPEAREPAEPSSSPPSPTASVHHAPRVAVAPAPVEVAVEPNAPAPSSAPLDDSFAAELRAIDRARRAIAGRDPAGGLLLLDAWALAFPHPHFEEEGTVLRIEALRGSGDREGSIRLAQQFLASHPGSPLAQRVRSQLKDAK